MTESELTRFLAVKLPGLFPRHKLGDEELDLLRDHLRKFSLMDAMSGLRTYRMNYKYATPDIGGIRDAIRDHREWQDRKNRVTNDEPPMLVQYLADQVRKKHNDYSMSDAEAIEIRTKSLIGNAIGANASHACISTCVNECRIYLRQLGIERQQESSIMDTILRYAKKDCHRETARTT